MNQLWDISRIPLPVQDMIGSDSCSNSYAEWFIDELAAPDTDNAVVDGADISQNDAATGNRVGNQCQTSVKEVQVSTRADNSNSGNASSRIGTRLRNSKRASMPEADSNMSTGRNT